VASEQPKELLETMAEKEEPEHHPHRRIGDVAQRRSQLFVVKETAFREAGSITTDLPGISWRYRRRQALKDLGVLRA